MFKIQALKASTVNLWSIWGEFGVNPGRIRGKFGVNMGSIRGQTKVNRPISVYRFPR